ncbi:hypothetical protein RYX36_016977, partial [Vicia faba]
MHELTDEIVDFSHTYHDLVHNVSLIIRLCNDLATTTAERERGDTASSIACYINEMDVSEKNARKHIQDIINGAWKKINGLCSTQNTLMEPFFNQARNAARPLILMDLYFATMHELTDEIADFSHTYQHLVYNVSHIIRLCNDLATTTAERERGDIASSIACYINQMDVSEENARKHIQEIINGAWKKINGLCSTQNALMEPFFNQARNAACMAHTLYLNEMDPFLLIIILIISQWIEFCKALFMEAKWYKMGYIPSLREYLSNASITSSGPLILIHSYFSTMHELTDEIVDFSHTYHDLVHNVSLIIRLCNDLATTTAERERGDTASSIACYINEMDVSEENARKHIQDIINGAWKKINGLCSTQNALMEPFFNQARNAARPLILIHSYFATMHELTDEIVDFSHTYQDLVYNVSLIIRLCNDLATTTAERERGDVASSIACYINEMDVSEENARKHIQEIINGAWKKINGLFSTQNALMEPFFNQARNAA